jgi:hypothetical protein
MRTGLSTFAHGPGDPRFSGELPIPRWADCIRGDKRPPISRCGRTGLVTLQG